MATNLNISENQERVPLAIGSSGVLRSITPDNGSPYYVGARAYVTQTASGATVTVIDKGGTTTAVILNGTNGINGQDGADGADGNGIVDISLTSSAANVDEYTITYDDGSTETFYVTNGIDGADGQDGQDGRDGVDGTDGEDGVGIVSITKTATAGLVDTYTILYSDGTTSTFDVTNGQNGSGSVADVWVDGSSVLDGDTAKIDLTGKSDVGHTHTKSAITDFPTLSTVATSGSYNDLSNKPTIPTKTSDITNDSGFITSSALPTKVSDLTNDSGFITSSALPTKVSDLTNDAGYISDYTETDPVFSASAASGITSSDISTWNGKSDFSGDYDDLYNKPTIPTDTGDLTNGAGFITAGVFEISTVAISVTVPNNDINNKTVTATKSGYYPLGIVGWHTSGTGVTLGELYRFYPTNATLGSIDINAYFRNGYTSSQTYTLTAYVLWVKAS